MNIRSAYTSAIAAMGLACSTSAFAGTVFVHAAYVPAVWYAPARTLNYVPPQPPYVVPVAPVVPVVPVVPYVAVLPPPAPAKPLPYATVAVPVVAAPAYPVVPARGIVYAQPVGVPVVVTR